jgi:hypothetical protein
VTQLDPIHLRHHDVADDQISAKHRGEFKRTSTAVGGDHFVTFRLKQIDQQIEYLLIVFNDQNKRTVV